MMNVHNILNIILICLFMISAGKKNAQYTKGKISKQLFFWVTILTYNNIDNIAISHSLSVFQFTKPDR